jgi:hypothetical protein
MCVRFWWGLGFLFGGYRGCLELWGPYRAVGFESTVSRGVKLPGFIHTLARNRSDTRGLGGGGAVLVGGLLLVALVFRV